MNRLHLMIVCLFLVALVTGVLLGMSMSHSTSGQTVGPAVGGPDHPPGGRNGNRGSWLAEQLKLSAAQAEQVREIWSDVLKANGADQRDQYRKDRDAAIMALLSPEQKTAYDNIQDHFKQQMTDMDKANEAAFNAATEKTKLVLNDDQRKQYEEMIKKGGFRGGPRGGRGGPQGTRPDGFHGGPDGGPGPQGHGPDEGPH